MKTSWKVLLGDLLLIGLVGLVLAEEKPDEKAAPKVVASQKTQTVAAPSVVVSSSDSPIIGYIERRDQTITIKAGPKGPLYSVKTVDGKILFENLSSEQLSAKAPELHEFLTTAVAAKGTADAKALVKADASLQIKGDARVR
jgi:hypothetical protein